MALLLFNHFCSYGIRMWYVRLSDYGFLLNSESESGRASWLLYWTVPIRSLFWPQSVLVWELEKEIIFWMLRVCWLDSGNLTSFRFSSKKGCRAPQKCALLSQIVVVFTVAVLWSPNNTIIHLRSLAFLKLPACILHIILFEAECCFKSCCCQHFFGLNGAAKVPNFQRK